MKTSLPQRRIANRALNHVFPESISSVIALLSDKKKKACVIAGSIDLSIDIRKRTTDFEIIVDIARILGWWEIHCRLNTNIIYPRKGFP